MNGADLDSRHTKSSPRWLPAALLAALTSTAICWPVWPGLMSYDGLLAYQQALRGVHTMLWPPLHTYIFALFQAGHLGPGYVLFAQVFLLFFSANLIFGLFLRRTSQALTAMLAMIALCILVPPVLGSLFAHWRDVPTASFALAGLALWGLGGRYRSIPLTVGGVFALCLALALRYNAIALIFPLLALIVISPLPGRRASSAMRLVVIAATLIGLSLSWASTRWRLPDLMLLPATGGFAAAQEFDLIGISACAGRDYLPPEVSSGAPMTSRQLRWAYDPRHLQLTLKRKAFVPVLVETDAGGKVQQTWREVVPHEFGCYLSHRTAVFVEQMGMAKAEVFYPVHNGLDANMDGLKLARPAAAGAARSYVTNHSASLWRRPFWLYVLGLCGVAAAFAARSPLAWTMAAMMTGALGYVGLLFLAAPAADARYIFPSSIFCIVLIALSAGIALAPRNRIEPPAKWRRDR